MSNQLLMDSSDDLFLIGDSFVAPYPGVGDLFACLYGHVPCASMASGTGVKVQFGIVIDTLHNTVLLLDTSGNAVWMSLDIYEHKNLIHDSSVEIQLINATNAYSDILLQRCISNTLE